MTGPEHYREAERLAASAEEWMDADSGWKSQLSAAERTARRSADLLAAQVHATLAQTDTAREIAREYVAAMNALAAAPGPATAPGPAAEEVSGP